MSLRLTKGPYAGKLLSAVNSRGYLRGLLKLPLSAVQRAEVERRYEEVVSRKTGKRSPASKAYERDMVQLPGQQAKRGYSEPRRHWRAICDYCHSRGFIFGPNDCQIDCPKCR